MSWTLTFSGRSSDLEIDLTPNRIALEENAEYVVGLISLYTYYSIPNIDERNNKFYYGEKDNRIEIPTGTYNISDLEKYLNKILVKQDVGLVLSADNNLMKTHLKCSQRVDFTRDDSIGNLLGFEKKVLPPNIDHFSDKIIDIFNVNSILVECSIASGAYHNNNPVHTIYEFFPDVPPGYKINEVPANIIYLPVTSGRVVDRLHLRLIDQERRLINFNGELITAKIHLKKVGWV